MDAPDPEVVWFTLEVRQFLRSRGLTLQRSRIIEVTEDVVRLEFAAEELDEPATMMLYRCGGEEAEDD